jgi:hypothetical protein
VSKVMTIGKCIRCDATKFFLKSTLNDVSRSIQWPCNCTLKIGERKKTEHCFIKYMDNINKGTVLCLR